MSRVGYLTDRKERERKFVLQHASFAVKRVSKIMKMAPQTDPIVSMISISSALAFGVDLSDIKGDSLWCIDVAARQIAMTLAYLIAPCPLRELAEYFDRADHTVILCAYRKYGADLILMCKANGIRLHDRIKGHRTTVSRGPHSRLGKRIKLAKMLDALMRWHGGPILSEDIFPDLDPHQRANVMGWLNRHGYASPDSENSNKARGWEITDKGLQEFKSLRHLIHTETEIKEAA